MLNLTRQDLLVDLVLKHAIGPLSHGLEVQVSFLHPEHSTDVAPILLAVKSHLQAASVYGQITPVPTSGNSPWCLEKHQVDDALCGGLAVLLHGHVRATRDIDVLIRREDLERVCKIVRELGATATSGKLAFEK